MENKSNPKDKIYRLFIVNYLNKVGMFVQKHFLFQFLVLV